MQQKIDGLLVPKLRFPEFLDAGEWEEKKLLEVCDVNPSNEELPEFFIYIDLESVVAGKLMYKKKICKKDAPSRAQRLLKNGDVIYQVVRPYQRNNFLFNFDDRNNYVASTGYAQLRSFGVSEFLYQLIHTDTFVNKVIAKCTGSNYPAINSSDLAEINVVIPLYSEQQKIADCLSSISDRITLESQKLDTLKAHKKGLMQQLFPAEGETLPKLRFPEFQDSGEWEKKQLGELLLNHPDYGVNAAAVTYSEDLPAYIRITDISDEGYYLCDKKVSVDIEAKNENYLSEGDIVLARTGASVGKSYKYRKEDGKLVFAGFLIRIKPDPKKLDSTFLFNFISTKQYWNWVSVNSARSGQPGINGNEYAALPVPVPPFEKDVADLPEQQKIADCLASLDELIAAQTQAIATLKTHKKGLMQQLFPSVEEVKG